jgi:hypothetical protein
MAKQSDEAKLAAMVSQRLAEEELKKIQQRQRLLGDPRTRVEVPVVKIDGNSQRLFSQSRRYQVG